jgi:hypothetical protein
MLLLFAVYALACRAAALQPALLAEVEAIVLPGLGPFVGGEALHAFPGLTLTWDHRAPARCFWKRSHRCETGPYAIILWMFG